jgi:hypothetical protein
MGSAEERRAPAPSFRLSGDLEVEVLVPIGEDHVVLPATVVELAEKTVTLAMEDGAAALTVAMTRRCLLVWGARGEEQCALVRSGRRVDDVHSPTTIELVLEEVRPLSEVAPRTNGDGG